MEFISLLNVQTSVASNSISMFVIQSCIFGGSEDSIQLSSSTKRVAVAEVESDTHASLSNQGSAFDAIPLGLLLIHFLISSFKPVSKIRIGYDCSCSSALFDVVLFL
jgi:hypothetical protein